MIVFCSSLAGDTFLLIGKSIFFFCNIFMVPYCFMSFLKLESILYKKEDNTTSWVVSDPLLSCENAALVEMYLPQYVKHLSTFPKSLIDRWMWG